MRRGNNLFLIVVTLLLLIIVGVLSFLLFKPKEKIVITFITNTEQKLDSIEINSGESINLPTIERENYNFVGWYVGDTKIDSNYKFENSTIVSAKWEEKEYTITFDTDGGNSIESITIKCGLIKLPPTPIKEGYTFEKWQDANGNIVDNNSELPCANQTIKAVWKEIPVEKKYMVTFNSDGGSAVASQTIKEGEKATKPNNPTHPDTPTGTTGCKTVYSFDKWQLDGKDYDFNTPVTKDITLKAIWNTTSSCGSKMFTVTFDSDGGSAVASQTVKEGEKAIKPQDPGHTQTTSSNCTTYYAFSRWTLNGKDYDFNTPVTKDITLKAAWDVATSCGGKVFTVTFDSDGGSAVASQTVEVGKTAKKPTNPTKSGYRFVEWQLDNKTYNFSTPVTMNITLKAKWEKGTTYTVTFDSNGGSAVAKQTVEGGKTATKPTNPTKTGYKFVEWQLDNKTYNFSTPVTKNITLKAKWEKGTTYTVTFDSDGGSAVKSQVVESGKTATKPVNPIKTGYNFVEWQLNGKVFNFSTKITKDITLKAKWEIATTHKVTFKTGEQICITCVVTSSSPCSGNYCKDVIYMIKEVKNGSVVEKPTNPTKTGYKFIEWQLNGVAYNFSNPVTSDITLVAKWQDENHVIKNKYTITLINENDSTKPQTKLEFACGATITGLPVLPSTRLYLFAGWYDKVNKKYYKNGDIMPCDDITLYSVYHAGDVVDKPIIYLYPEKEMDVTVKLGYPNLLTTVYPKYNNGWKVTAYPDGKLIDKNTGRNLYSLYWEGKNYPGKVTDEGFIVKGEDTIKFLEEKLAILGLNERETEEFIIYWLPQMEHNKYNYIKFATKEEIDSYMPLEITPKPDTIIRVMMEFMPLDKKIEVKEQRLTKVERAGYVAVEWGGSKITG